MTTETDRQQGAGSGQQDDPESDGTLTLTAEQAGALRRARVERIEDTRRYIIAKEDAKQCKEVMEGAEAHERGLIDRLFGEAEPMPLFDGHAEPAEGDES